MLKVLAVLFIMSVQAYSETGEATSNIKLRSQASIQSEALGTVSEGSSFEILGQEGEFYRINSQGQEGYVAAQYVEIKNPLTLQEKMVNWAIFLFGLFGLITGELMIRSYMMRFFGSLTFISYGSGKIGDGPVFMFLDFLEKKVIWELFTAVVSIAIGCSVGWIYVLYRVFKAKSSSAPTYRQDIPRQSMASETSEGLSNWPPRGIQKQSENG